jgi:hypothetical protein
MKFLRDSVSSRFSRKLIPAVLLSIFLISGCNPDRDPPPWKLCEDAQTKPDAAKSELPSTDHLVVYLDTSASMAGYVSPNKTNQFAVSSDGRSVFSRTLLELRNVVTLLAPQPSVVVRRVDVGVSEDLMPDSKLSEAALTRGFFNGAQTDLAGAVKKFSEPLVKDSQDKNPPRFHILVTDGVQSTKESNLNTNCDKGSDAICVKKQLLALLGKGWNGTILGVRGEFDGTIYSEIKDKQSFNFSSNKEPARFRPFFLYIFSPDAKALEKLTVSLKQRLGEFIKNKADLREYSLGADYTTGPATLEVQSPNKDYIELKTEQKEGANPRLTARIDLDTESDGAKEFTAAVKIPWSHRAETGGSPEEVLALVKWELIRVPYKDEEKGLRFPTFKLVKQEIKDGNAFLTFSGQWVRDSGTPEWGMYRLVGKFDMDKPALPWIRTWSTVDDTKDEYGSQILNLESTLGNLWRNNSLENYNLADICIRVYKK